MLIFLVYLVVLREGKQSTLCLGDMVLFAPPPESASAHQGTVPPCFGPGR